MQKIGNNPAFLIPRTSATAYSAGLKDIMKSWNGYSDALVAPRRAPAGTRFLTAAFAALVIIAGLDTIFPTFKYHFIPELSTQPPLGAGHTQKPFQWPQVRVGHS